MSFQNRLTSIIVVKSYTPAGHRNAKLYQQPTVPQGQCAIFHTYIYRYISAKGYTIN